MHKVLRTFTHGRGRVRVNDIVDGSRYRNLGFLVRRGFLSPVDDNAKPTPAEETPEAVPEEMNEGETVEMVVEIPPRKAAETGVTENADIIDQLAGENQTPVEGEAEIAEKPTLGLQTPEAAPIKQPVAKPAEKKSESAPKKTRRK